jgi:outer membrane protein
MTQDFLSPRSIHPLRPELSGPSCWKLADKLGELRRLRVLWYLKSCPSLRLEGEFSRSRSLEDLSLAIEAITSERLRLGFLGLCLLGSTAGCYHERYCGQTSLVERVLPPPNAADPAKFASAPEEISAPGKATPDGATPPPAVPTNPPAAIDPTRVKSSESPRDTAIGPDFRQALGLPEAIGLAFQLQPRLRASLESIQQARGRADIAYSAFLPTVSTGYSVGGFEFGVGGQGVPIPGSAGSPAFNFFPPGGVIPVGLNLESGYELAELKLQWLVCDFGRRMGQYNQAGLATDIAQLQTDRAYQTVADDVATAYYQVLRVRSLRRIAVESVRRATDDLDVARNLAKGGVIEREKVLRAEVALAQAQRANDVAEEADGVAVAALNLAIGLNVSAVTEVKDMGDIPPFTKGIADCLQVAVAERREFQVARKSVQVAQEGSRVAHADFAPRIVAEGSLADYEQSSPRGHADLGLGFIKLEWALFEGGKRVAEQRVDDSKIREAMARADSIADTIAFQVNQAYRQMIAARKGINRARPAVDQSLETYRLVAARGRQGDATPAELTDAQAGLTRAQQDYANSIYDYLTALARLEYAMGTAPSAAARSSP